MEDGYKEAHRISRRGNDMVVLYMSRTSIEARLDRQSMMKPFKDRVRV